MTPSEWMGSIEKLRAPDSTFGTACRTMTYLVAQLPTTKRSRATASARARRHEVRITPGDHPRPRGVKSDTDARGAVLSTQYLVLRHERRPASGRAHPAWPAHW